MNNESSKRRVLAPYLCALITMIAVYLAVVFATGQPMLSFAAASVGALFAYIASRLIQLRGRVTLAIAVIGLPLLFAMAFAGYQALLPFVKRQRTVDILRDRGIGYYARRPAQAGEWKRDRQGNMLPVWLADWIGPECLGELKSIESDLARLQNAPFDEFVVADNVSITVVRTKDDPPISAEFVAWLNTLPLRQLQISLSGISADDARSLAKLKVNYAITIFLDANSGDLSSLSAAKNIGIVGHTVSVEQARQVSKLEGVFLGLDVRTLSADSIAAFNGEHSLAFLRLTRTRLDEAAWHALSQLDVPTLTLDRVSTKSIPATSIAKSNPDGVTRLSILGSPLSADDALNLTRLFPVRDLILSQTGLSNPPPSCWDAGQLKTVRIHDGKSWVDHEPPSIKNGSK